MPTLPPSLQYREGNLVLVKINGDILFKFGQPHVKLRIPLLSNKVFVIRKLSKVR